MDKILKLDGNMTELQEYKYSILASLRVMPGTFEELKCRDFLKPLINSSMCDYAIDSFLRSLEKENLIYKRGEVYHAYKTKWVEDTLSRYGYLD